MRFSLFLIIIFSSIILFFECSGKISKKVTDMNTGLAEGTGKISGKVANQETGEALPGSNVVIIGKNIGAATDTNGLYTISNVTPGSYSMQARAMGYKSITFIDVIVVVDSTTTISFQLSPEEIKEEGVRLGPK